MLTHKPVGFTQSMSLCETLLQTLLNNEADSIFVHNFLSDIPKVLNS